MVAAQPYLIYNASAGSGKTYTLVKTYVSILFKATSPLAFKNILAITFTNKAAGEMKTRILDTLKTFSSETTNTASNTMFNDICAELQISPKELQTKSATILDAILHNYAAFDISTIDGFTHKIIRTFAHDLKLPLNFEVALDTERLLEEAVDQLISRAGTDVRLTKILVDFALEKADDDKSWDVSRDFYAIAKLLISENDRPYIASIQDKTLDDFKNLKTSTLRELEQAKNLCIKTANAALNIIAENGLSFENFSRGSVPNYFKKIAEGNFTTDINDRKWVTDLLEGQPIYPKTKTKQNVATIIDGIQPKLADYFNACKKAVLNYTLLNDIYRHLTPLSVLSAINNELTLIKEDQNLILISDFNTLISREIKNQPTPFIYERIGEKFKHYFIDEFQDTSELQWQNLIPLLDNAVASKPGSIMLVGDAKQAIYRWRGGKAEQFMGLYNKTKNPFYLEPEIIPLESNYRSYQEIITFNNGFFNYLSDTVFSQLEHKSLYKNAQQKSQKEASGFVQLAFLDGEAETDTTTAYCEEVYQTITSCLDHGYTEADICVLVRKNKDGVAVANYLAERQVTIMSSESLLLDSSEHVRFINNLLRLMLQPDNQDVKAAILYHISQLCQISDIHNFLKAHVYLSPEDLFKKLTVFGYSINYNQLFQLAFYDLVETLVRDFKLITHSDAFIQYYMDIVLEFSEKNRADIGNFLHYYDSKKHKLSIVTPEGYPAVQIMTIHKSKGLEFPVVIFPFADINIYSEMHPKEWFPLNPEAFNGFQYTLLNYSKKFETYGAQGKAIFDNHQAQLELDNLNILYVALTRPVEQLYIISKLVSDTKSTNKQASFNEFFINYLKHLGLWQDNQQRYQFGQQQRSLKPKAANLASLTKNKFLSTPKESHNIKVITRSGSLWDTAQGAAIEKGNLIHTIMAHITTPEDVNSVMEAQLKNGTINQQQEPHLRDIVLQLITHPKLKAYFAKSGIRVYNERDIIANNDQIIRPDRLVFLNNKDVVLIDYKSGKEEAKHLHQLADYETILTSMNFNVTKKILIYINDSIAIKEF
ncbi:UvrD-helicase domain-containing protein [Bizionia sediminis]|uniref:DNA 3'-5' helicase n=1 Tax=Bizionia sediminis TaxID=1737064 RepID=A0ABW5KT71_9FLAO